MSFRDRADAGRRLAEALTGRGLADPVVAAMARGGVPVGAEISEALGAPLDVVVVRKLGHPSQPELGMGAIAEGGVRVVNEELLAQLGVSEELVERVARREAAELDRRLQAYRGGTPGVDVSGRTVVVVDDGLATGFTALAAVNAMRARGARRVVLAVPVAPPGAIAKLRSVADEVVCLVVTDRFLGLSEWYDDFHQVDDREVVEILARSRDSRASSASAGAPGVEALEVDIPSEGHVLEGELRIPQQAVGIVVFAHGSGSGRMSPRNRAVAEALNASALATLLFDLLTEEEARDRSNVFDVPLLARRVEDAVRLVAEMPATAGKPVGLFGASTGAAAALVAAAGSQAKGAGAGADGATPAGPAVAAVVSRGGRPDLAGDALASVHAPTLLIVGSRDEVVLELNRRALARIPGEGRLEIVQGATHLFEEPGALEQVARLASGWFGDHLGH